MPGIWLILIVGKVFEADKMQGLGLSAQEEGLGIGRGLAPILPNSNLPVLAGLIHENEMEQALFHAWLKQLS
jgi:hypothetical protein